MNLTIESLSTGEWTAVIRGQTEGAFPSSIVMSRWLLIGVMGYVVVFGSANPPGLVHELAIAAMILSNAWLTWARTRGRQWKTIMEVMTVVDVLFVTLVASWIDSSPETYVGVFAALILASVLGKVWLSMLLIAVVCGLYAGYLYVEIDPVFWRQSQFMLRMPFLFTIGLYFATIATHLREETQQRDQLEIEARRQSDRAKQMAREQGRLRALSHIGRIGLTSADRHPVEALLEIGARTRNALVADHCSLMMFASESPEWSGQSLDKSVDVRTLGAPPETLKRLLLEGNLTELHSDSKIDIVDRLQPFFGEQNPLGTLLVAAVKRGDKIVGALFLISGDPSRRFNDGERDFFWTVALMTGALIQARDRMENEVRLRTLITNAPVIMFALDTFGNIDLFEGRALATLGRGRDEIIGQTIFELSSNPTAARRDFDATLGGRVHTSTLEIDGILFETQYSPLRGLDGNISGVMGVTTAVFDRPVAAPDRPAAAPAAGESPAQSSASRGAFITNDGRRIHPVDGEDIAGDDDHPAWASDRVQ